MRSRVPKCEGPGAPTHFVKLAILQPGHLPEGRVSGRPDEAAGAEGGLVTQGCTLGYYPDALSGRRCTETLCGAGILDSFFRSQKRDLGYTGVKSTPRMGQPRLVRD